MLQSDSVVLMQEEHKMALFFFIMKLHSSCAKVTWRVSGLSGFNPKFPIKGESLRIALEFYIKSFPLYIHAFIEQQP